ncbi:MAG: putative DNA-binding domain-containing protein [Deltaproteobacteria bacterium]|nr:putative DNA-binding domain-containing protein [Deltaproteobacteria bacterium]
MKPQPTLRQLQEFLYWIITEPRDAAGIVQNDPAACRERLGGADWTEIFAPRPGRTPARRLDVYADGYPARMFDALAENYPSVRRVCGDQSFLSLAGRYARAHPSTHYNLGEAGRHLPDYLKGDALTADLPFLPDLAELDAACMQVFHASALPPLDPGRLQSASPDRLGGSRLVFQNATRLMESRWPVATIREMRDVPDEEFRVRVEDNPERCVVFRSGFSGLVRRLEAAEFAALSALMTGSTVWGAIEAAATHEKEPPVGAWFGEWVSSGLVVDLTPPG